MIIQKTYRIGEKYTHSTSRENAISEMLNKIQQTGSFSIHTKSAGVVKVPCWNASNKTIKAGTAVIFDPDFSMSGDAFPVVHYQSGIAPVFGVVQTAIEKNEIGNAIVSGVVRIQNYTGAGYYALPENGGELFVLGDTGIPVLYSTQNEVFLILGGNANAENYVGPFAITYNLDEFKINVGAGFINANGIWMMTENTMIEPANGYICATVDLNTNTGEWEVPAIQITTPSQKAFPLGYCQIMNDLVYLTCFKVPVAIFIISGEC